MILLAFLLVVSTLLLRIPSVQTYLSKKAINYIENWIGTEVSTSNIKVDIFNNIQLDDFLIRDEQGDTLIFTKQLAIDINEFALLNRKLDINDLAIQQAYLNIYPVNDSTFNYQFILDELIGETTKSTDTEEDETNTKQSFQLLLDDILLQNTRVKFEDLGGGTIVDVNLNEANIEMETIDFNEIISLKNVELKNPNVKLWISDAEDDTEDTDTSLTLFPSLPFNITAQQLAISNGNFSLKEGKPLNVNKGYIDWKNLLVENININLANINWHKDTIDSEIKNIQLTEISGFKVNEFNGQFTMSSKQLSIDNLLLKTNFSQLQNAYSMEYESLDDFLDFEPKVYLRANLKKSSLDWRDLEYFVPAFSENDIATRFKGIQKLKLNGSLKGTIDNLKGKNIEIAHKDNFYFNGDFKLKGLPDIDNTFIDFDIQKLRTNTSDVLALIPEAKLPENILTLGKLDFEGEFLGFFNDFVAEGRLDTEIGSAITDINMKLKGLDNATYSGDLQVIDFQLGKFLNQEKTVGNINLNASIKGTGLTFSTAKATVDGKVQSFELNGFEYKDVIVDGTFDQKIFNGKVNIAQEEVNFDFEGTINLADASPVYQFKSNIIRMNLKEVGIANEPYILTLTSDLNMQGTDIDDFIGTANFKDISLEKDGETYPIATAQIISEIEGDQRSLQLKSNVVDANFEGHFGFKNLVNSFKEYLSSYFPYNIQYDDSLAVRDLEIKFDIQLKETTNITQLFIPELTEVEEGEITGYFNNRNRTLTMKGNLPGMIFDNVIIDSVKIEAVSNYHELLVSTKVDNVEIDNFNVPKINLNARIAQDSINTHLTVNKGANNGMDLHGVANVRDNELNVWVDSLQLNVAGLPWRMVDERLRFKNVADYEMMDWTLAYKNQFLNLGSFPNDENNTTLLYLKGINLGEFAELADLKSLEAGGLVNGNIEVLNLFKAPLVSGNLDIVNGQIFGEQLGRIKINADKKPGDKRIELTASVSEKNYNLNATGYYDLGLEKEEALYINALINKFPMTFVQGILKDQLKDTKGYAQGEIYVTGPISAPKLSGELLTKDIETTIDFLNVRYRVGNRILSLENNNIYFDELVLYDKFNNVAELNGKLALNDFNDVSVAVSAVTDEFLLLNTPRSENQIFYGTALGSGFIVFEGPVDDIYMYFNIVSKEGTKIALPLTDDYNVSGNEVYSFIQKGELESDEQTQEEKRIDFQVDMDFELNPNAELQLIFDYQAGDIIEAQGNGNIQIGYNSKNDDFSIYGNYDITDGDYLFTLQNIVNKRFEIEPGSRIDFFGDPYKANIDIETTYRFKTSLYELVEVAETSDLLESEELKKRVPVELKLNLTEELGTPNIDFKIELPDQSLTSFNSTARQRINEINNDGDKNELNRQVFGLLVFNKFLPSNSNLFGNEYITSSVSTTMSEFLSNQFSNLLSETISEIIPDSELSVNWRNYTSEGIADPTQTDPEVALYNRNEIELTYRQKLFNNRVIIDIGGNFDVGERFSEDYDNVALAGDFVMQYKITPDGFYRIKLFAKTDSDIFTGRYNKTGVSLSVTEDFNNFKDLVQIFKDRRAARKKKKQERRTKKQTTDQ